MLRQPLSGQEGAAPCSTSRCPRRSLCDPIARTRYTSVLVFCWATFSFTGRFLFTKRTARTTRGKANLAICEIDGVRLGVMPTCTYGGAALLKQLCSGQGRTSPCFPHPLAALAALFVVPIRSNPVHTRPQFLFRHLQLHEWCLYSQREQRGRRGRRPNWLFVE